MEKLLFANPDKCTGCNRCAYACSAQKEGEFAPSKARIFVNNFPFKGYSAPSICFQCPKANCQEACPEGALYRNEDGVVLVDGEKCTGCAACVEACPYGVIELGAQKIARKCDYCGGDPACVKECFPGALVFQEAEPALVKLKAAQMKQRSSCGSASDKRRRLGAALLDKARD